MFQCARYILAYWTIRERGTVVPGTDPLCLLRQTQWIVEVQEAPQSVQTNGCYQRVSHSVRQASYGLSNIRSRYHATQTFEGRNGRVEDKMKLVKQLFQAQDTLSSMPVFCISQSERFECQQLSQLPAKYTQDVHCVHRNGHQCHQNVTSTLLSDASQSYGW